jgi:hypothetical protein
MAWTRRGWFARVTRVEAMPDAVSVGMRYFLLAAFCPLLSAFSAAPLDLGQRWELLVDEFLIAKKNGAELKLHQPVKKNIVLSTDQPWEGPTCSYFTVIQEGAKVRLYYRASAGGSDRSADQLTCLAESSDGIHFMRPKLGLIEVNGSKENNVVWRGVESHNFTPFIDVNPDAKPGERYKALGGVKMLGADGRTADPLSGLYAFISADGISWQKMKPDPVMTKGAFDSQNISFWDATRGHYVCFSRLFISGVRAVQSNTSADFISWTDPVPHRYAEGVPVEQFYTSATVQCPTAPHLFLSFPMRLEKLRKKITEHKNPGICDAVFMSSRDGVNWDRPFLEAWSRPGPDQKNWTDRNNMTANGIIVTGDEWSLYISEHYRHADHRLRRLTVRKQGFASMHAGSKGGEFTTHPLKVTGKKLVINYATSAVGFVQIEALDASGKVVAAMPEFYGDEFEASVLDLAKLGGQVIQLRLKLKDADLYALRFAE